MQLAVECPRGGELPVFCARGWGTGRQVKKKWQIITARSLDSNQTRQLQTWISDAHICDKDSRSLKVLLRSKNIFIFSSDFETLFTKQSPCEILGLNFEKTVY